MFFAKSDRAAPEAERRGEQRSRMLKGGTLSFNKGYGALECVVRDLSAHGARLRFGDTSAVPQQFSLRVGTGGEWRNAEVRWRTMTDVGVALG
ncbi:MAG: PilZ domain-containing protein [Rhizobiaceae bacterium]|nr:PilZ domain-containing protein [Rhizobiaceae bacterium]